MERRGWNAGAAAVLVLFALLLGVLSLVLAPGAGSVMAASVRAVPTEHEVRFVGERPDGSSSSQAGAGQEAESPSHATLVGRLRTDDPTFSGAFELVVESTDGRFGLRDLLDLGDAFRFDGLAPGPLRIELREPRLPLQWWIEELSLRLLQPYQRRFASHELVLRPGETRVDVVLGLDPAASCRVIGWLVGVNDDPSLRYRVEVGRRKCEVATDGSFDLGLLSPDQNMLKVDARASQQEGEPSWFEIAALALELRAGEMRTLQVDVPHVARVSPEVRIRGSDRMPADVWIHYRVDDDSARSFGNRLATVLLPYGDHRVVVRAKGYRLVHTTLRVVAEMDELRPLLELEPASPRPILCVDGSGAPLAENRITVQIASFMSFFPITCGESITDEAGIVDLGFLADRPYALWARTGDRMSQASLEPGATSAAFEVMDWYVVVGD